MRKTIFEERNESIWIKIELYETEEGKIVLHGLDSGNRVRELKQKDEYEYIVSISKERIPILLEKLDLDDKAELFNWIVSNYSHHRAISQIKAELDRLQVKYEFSTW